MKIIVDCLPKHSKECLFSKRSPEYGFYCSFDKKECRVGLCDFLRKEETNETKESNFHNSTN